MSRESLLKKMADCDVFLFASLRDGGGAVVVEAMAAGKPVICLDIGGPGFHINEKYGIKIKPDSPSQTIQEIADSLFLLHKNNSLRQSLGAAGRKRAESFYSWNKLGEQLLKIYENTIYKH
jgi:glycosyltransferase involved in cell wall biosynthesis